MTSSERSEYSDHFASIPDAVAAIARGEIVVVVDDEDRENEGDLIMASEAVTPEKIAATMGLDRVEVAS
jgi:3,4-dihydroxy-2-butanone 4-phosphate synthase